MNSGGNAAVVRVYQLAGQTNFKRTPLSTFWKNNEQALGNELISKKQVLLYPDEEKSIEFKVSKKTVYIGVAADLRSPDQEEWRAIHPVGKFEDEPATVTVMANRISVETN